MKLTERSNACGSRRIFRQVAAEGDTSTVEKLIGAENVKKAMLKLAPQNQAT